MYKKRKDASYIQCQELMLDLLKSRKGELIMWINTKYNLPPEGQIVETKIVDEKVGDHNICKLIRHGNLWFFTDMKMYVYYVPTHWRYVQDKGD